MYCDVLPRVACAVLYCVVCVAYAICLCVYVTVSVLCVCMCYAVRGCPGFSPGSETFGAFFKNGFLDFRGSVAVRYKTHYFADFCMNKVGNSVRIAGVV